MQNVEYQFFGWMDAVPQMLCWAIVIASARPAAQTIDVPARNPQTIAVICVNALNAQTCKMNILLTLTTTRSCQVGMNSNVHFYTLLTVCTCNFLKEISHCYDELTTVMLQILSYDHNKYSNSICSTYQQVNIWRWVTLLLFTSDIAPTKHPSIVINRHRYLFDIILSQNFIPRPFLVQIFDNSCEYNILNQCSHNRCNLFTSPRTNSLHSTLCKIVSRSKRRAI